jgi:quercetin dioxygenase-like cupin family protein
MTAPRGQPSTIAPAPLLPPGPWGTGNATFAVAEYTEGPAPGGAPRTVAPLHRHREEDEAWYVLEGELTVRLDDREVRASPGGAVWSRPNVAHTFWNSTSSPTRYLLIMGPKTHAFLEGLHADPLPESGALRALADRCGIDLLE